MPGIVLHDDCNEFGRRVSSGVLTEPYVGRGSKYNGHELAQDIDGLMVSPPTHAKSEWDGFKFDRPLYAGDSISQSFIIPGRAEEVFQYVANARSQAEWNSLCSEILTEDPTPEGVSDHRTGEGMTVGMCSNFYGYPTWFGRSVAYHYHYTHMRKFSGKCVPGKEDQKDGYWYRCVSYSPALRIHTLDTVFITDVDDQTCSFRFVIGIVGYAPYLACLAPIPLLTWGLLAGMRLVMANLERCLHARWEEAHKGEVNPVEKTCQTPMSLSLVVSNFLLASSAAFYVKYWVIVLLWGMVAPFLPTYSGWGVVGLAVLYTLYLIATSLSSVRAGFYEEFPPDKERAPKWAGDPEGDCPGGALYGWLTSGGSKKAKGRRATREGPKGI